MFILPWIDGGVEVESTFTDPLELEDDDPESKETDSDASDDVVFPKTTISWDCGLTFGQNFNFSLSLSIFNLFNTSSGELLPFGRKNIARIVGIFPLNPFSQL